MYRIHIWCIAIYWGCLPIPCNGQKRFIEVDSIDIWVNTMGLDHDKPNEPVVVFENGHGVPMDNWDRVLPKVAEFATVVTYDRPGVGKSEAVNETPSMQHVADRLVRILEELSLEPPYLLVGHSLGGLYVRGFPIYYPELTAGLVIVDPADFTETLTNRRDYYDVLSWPESKVDSLIQSYVDRRKNGNTETPTSINREGQYLEDMRNRNFKELHLNPLPNVPVHILVGGRFDMPAHLQSDQFDDEQLFRSKMSHRIRRWTNVVQTVDRGKLLYSSHSGHYIQWEDPDLVVASIKMVLNDFLLQKEKGE